MTENTQSEQFFPDTPVFSEEEIRYCKETGDYRPVLFEWYKHVGAICVCVANILPDCPAYKSVDPHQYYVLAGLLNRCSRLMLSNIALSHEGKFGETTAIVDRCIFESAVKVIWLSYKGDKEEFDRYIADGLRTEIEFRARIEIDIKNDGGQPSNIQARMLKSIDRHIAASGLTADEIKVTKKQRDMSAIIECLGFDRLIYITAQRIGSHHVHGTWPSLLFNYLEERDEDSVFSFRPKSSHDNTNINQFMFIPIIVLHALGTFVRYVLREHEAKTLSESFDSIEDEIRRVYGEAGEDAR